MHSFYFFQALKLNPIQYLRFTNSYGKANKETHPLDIDCLTLSQWETFERSNIDICLNGAYVWNPNVPLYNKTTCLLKEDASIEIYQLLLISMVICRRLTQYFLCWHFVRTFPTQVHIMQSRSSRYELSLIRFLVFLYRRCVVNLTLNYIYEMLCAIWYHLCN